MFVARRVIKHDKTYQPGEIIPGFDKWPEVPKRALLSLEWVEQVPDLPRQADPMEVTEVHAPKKAVKKKSK